MPQSKTTSLSIAEMREFASFTADEQSFITRSLDVFMGRGDAFKRWGREAGSTASIRTQYIAYRELRALRESRPCTHLLDGIASFIGALVRISAQDLAQEQLSCFSAYRFLY